MVARALVIASLLFPSVALAQLAGVGRITIEPGWRLTPNDHFAEAASAAGAALTRTSPGGPTLAGSFAYSATGWLEIGIDLFAGAEQLRLQGQPALTSITYGGALGVRLQAPLEQFLFAERFVPFAGLLSGPTLIDVVGGNLQGTNEKVTASYILSAGFTFQVDQHWGITAEYRLLLARGMVDGIGSINGGGSWFSLGITFLIPSDSGEHSDSLNFQ